MRLLFLYAEVMGYTTSTLKALTRNGAEIHIISWDKKKITPYEIERIPNVFHYPRSNFSFLKIMRLACKIKPEITIISGWMDYSYLICAFILRSMGLKTVIAFDTQWRASLKQLLFSFCAKLGLLKLFFSSAWVPGKPQHKYALKLGFKEASIAHELYCADLELFNKFYFDSIPAKKIRYPHCFLFVGRLEPIKGLETLLSAWELIADKKLDWQLKIIGSGSLRERLNYTPNIFIQDFLRPQDIGRQINSSGCLIIPSNHEPWGVVSQEFAAAGLPILASDAVTSTEIFLKDGVNGYAFRRGNSSELAQLMMKIINTSDAKLLEMSEKSHDISALITPESSARNILSL